MHNDDAVVPWYDGWRPSRREADHHARVIAESWRLHGVHKWMAYDRETAAVVHWTSAGENIGEGGPVANTTAAIAQMAVGLTQSMLNEKPPDDGHRRNILSSSFTHIGIAVFRDSSGTVWLTQDFSN